MKNLGIGFLAFGIIAILINLYLNTAHNILWFCNHMSIILGLAFIYNNKEWVTAELNIALIPQVLWSIDYLGKLIFNTHPFGFTDYMFAAHYEPALWFLSLSHLIITPVALYGLWKIGKPVWALKQSLIHGVILLPVSYLFANGHNINCILNSCVPFIPTTPIYWVIWPILAVLIILLTNAILVKVGGKKKRTKKSTRKKPKSRKRR